MNTFEQIARGDQRFNVADMEELIEKHTEVFRDAGGRLFLEAIKGRDIKALSIEELGIFQHFLKHEASTKLGNIMGAQNADPVVASMLGEVEECLKTKEEEARAEKTKNHKEKVVQQIKKPKRFTTRGVNGVLKDLKKAA